MAQKESPTLSLASSEEKVDFPDVFSDEKTLAPNNVIKKNQEAVSKETEDFTENNGSKSPHAESPDESKDSRTNTEANTETDRNASQESLSNRICSSLKELVVSGESNRKQFPLVPSKVALLIIDVQDYLSSPSSIREEENDAYFYQTSLPNMITNIEKLLHQTRQQRNEQTQGCEVIFTYLEALTQDCRDVSLDYKLSGPQLATLPNAPVQPAKFLETVQPLLRDGKGDIMIPKTSCSVFMSTNLHYVLQNLHVEQLVVCGQLTEQCVESAVRDAADLGYFVTVVEDACGAKSREAHERGLSGMKGFSRIVDTQQVLEELQNPSEDEIVVASKSIATEPSEEEAIAHPRHIAHSSCHISIVPVDEWIVPSSNNDAVTTALLRTMQFAGVKFLRYTTVDAYNSIRSKAVPLHRLAKSKRLDHQVSIAQVCFAGLPTYGDYVVEATGLDARHVLTVEPDVGSLRILPYAPTAAAVMGTAMDPITNNASPLCTRGLLSRVVETARQHGIEFSVGAEIEFCLYKNGAPVDQSVFANTTTLNEQESFLCDLDTQLEQQQIQVEQIHAESAPGQVEVVLEYQPNPVHVADVVVLCGETITAVAKHHGMQAVFLPKLLADKAGNGFHLHFSFRDTTTQRANSFPHATLNGELSGKAKSFMEGILQHLPALISLTLPTNNSFRRVGPGCWTGSGVGWETEDKEAAIRVCMDTCTGEWTNVEYKLCDSTANIYLVLSGVLACGLDGIVQNLSLRPPLREAQESSWNNDKQASLPGSLQESLECLRNDDFLCQNVMGPQLSKAYIAVRQAESEKFHNLSLEEEVAMALH